MKLMYIYLIIIALSTVSISHASEIYDSQTIVLNPDDRGNCRGPGVCFPLGEDLYTVCDKYITWG